MAKSKDTSDQIIGVPQEDIDAVIAAQSPVERVTLEDGTVLETVMEMDDGSADEPANEVATREEVTELENGTILTSLVSAMSAEAE